VMDRRQERSIEESEETAITFEVDVPTVQEFESRITKTLTQFPYLVAEVDGKVVGTEDIRLDLASVLSNKPVRH